MRTGIAPSSRRRTVLKWLAGSIAGIGLSDLGPRLALAAEAPVQLGDAAMALELDADLRSRVIARQGSTVEPLTDFEASETLRLADGQRIDRFAFLDQRSEPVEDMHGSGTRHVLRGRADEGIEKEIDIVFYDRHPGFALKGRA